MTNLRYRVIINSNNKGAGYAAKKALSYAIGNGFPITKVRLGESKSDRAVIYVEVSDENIKNRINEILQNSGRMPITEGAWGLESIELIKEKSEQNLEEKLETRVSEDPRNLKARCNLLIQEKEELQLEKEGLNHEIEELKTELQEYKKEISPLESLIKYFKTITKTVTPLLEKEREIDYGIYIFEEGEENTFLNYVNHYGNLTLTQEELDKILEFDIEKATKETNAILKKLEQIRTPTKQELAIYRKATTELDKNAKIREVINRLKLEYKEISEKIELLKESPQSMPILIDYISENPRIYFPIERRNMKIGILEYLSKELTSMLEVSQIKVIDHKLLAYEIDSKEPININEILGKIPTTIRFCGYDDLLII